MHIVLQLICFLHRYKGTSYFLIKLCIFLCSTWNRCRFPTVLFLCITMLCLPHQVYLHNGEYRHHFTQLPRVNKTCSLMSTYLISRTWKIFYHSAETALLYIWIVYKPIFIYRKIKHNGKRWNKGNFIKKFMQYKMKLLS